MTVLVCKTDTEAYVKGNSHLLAASVLGRSRTQLGFRRRQQTRRRPGPGARATCVISSTRHNHAGRSRKEAGAGLTPTWCHGSDPHRPGSSRLLADLKHIAKEKALGSDGSPSCSWLCPRWGLVTEGSCLQIAIPRSPHQGHLAPAGQGLV